MNFIDTKTVIIIVLAIALLITTDGCGTWGSRNEESTTTTVTTDTIWIEKTRVSTAENKVSDTTKQTIVDNKGEITKVDPDHRLTPEEEEDGSTLREVNELKEVSTLENGTITSNILFTGEILKTDYILNTHTPTVTKTVETETIVNASGLYGYLGTTLGLMGNVQAAAAGIEYVHKNRFIIGTGVRYNLDPFYNGGAPNRLGLDLKLSVKF